MRELEDTFHLGIEVSNTWFYSNPLQLPTSDWSQTFYMPTISGTLPLDGTIRTAIKTNFDVSILSISSAVSNEIRLLKISSSHIFSNYLTHQIQVACFAVPEGDRIFDCPPDLMEKISFSVAPNADKTSSGVSITRWYTLDPECDSNSSYVLYVAFSLKGDLGWSCPVKVDETLSRRSFSIKCSDRKHIPLVLIAQERKGQVYLSLSHDDCPQTLIENRSAIALFCAQSSASTPPPALDQIVHESPHFRVFTLLEPDSSVFYTMPFVSEKFPDLPQTCFSERIVFKTHDESQWSTPVSITNDSEQFVKIPSFGDVKLVVNVTAFTTLLTITSVSQVEISAIDIRGRLSRHELGKSDEDDEKSLLLKQSLSGTTLSSSSEDYVKNSVYRSLFVPTVPTCVNWEHVQVLAFVKSFTVSFFDDKEIDLGVASFTFDGIGVEIVQRTCLHVDISVADIQFDNCLYAKESYDFPVVIVSQDKKSFKYNNIFNVPLLELLELSNGSTLMHLSLKVETWRDPFHGDRRVTGVKEIKAQLNPLSCYIEDLYINRLVDYFNTLFPTKIGQWNPPEVPQSVNSKTVTVRVPELILWQAVIMARPLNIKLITVEPLSILISVHCSLKMYIALDQSPLQFAKFERRRIITTPYRLGHAMTMHYLSGAIFGAGWVVSSLELLGSPSGLARAMGTGLRDFVSLPYRGLIQGPWAFLRGVTHGSASLMRHMTAGTLQSVTKLASSVARNLDRLTLDDEHLRRTEEQRRLKPQGLTQGFMQGLTGLGISMLGAVGGIAHHPLQSLMSDGASPRSLAAGVGLGLVGVFTKPLSGAAELVALTGQGLLQGAGWNSLPQPRICEVRSHSEANSPLRYEWKLLHSITYKNVLYVTEATVIANLQFTAVALILTSDCLIVVSLDEDLVKRIVSLSQLQVVQCENDPTLLSLKVISRIEEESVVMEMDPACRARVADFVRSTASLLQLPVVTGEVDGESVASMTLHEESGELLNFYVNPQSRNYLISLLLLARLNSNSYTFPVL